MRDLIEITSMPLRRNHVVQFVSQLQCNRAAKVTRPIEQFKITGGRSHRMMHTSDGHKDMPIDRASWEALCELLARLCDSALKESDWMRLNELLNEHSEARRYYLRYIAVHSALKANAGSPLGTSDIDRQLTIERLALDRFAGCTTVVDRCPRGFVGDEHRWWSILRYAMSISAVLLIGVTIVWRQFSAESLKHEAAPASIVLHRARSKSSN